VDFRELVKDLASTFRTRIELRQIGIRDEAKMMGGLGICGRKFCCANFLSDFVQVSIKMAKEQNFSLNSAKTSGACGRLMCCLRYEHDTYEEAIKRTPPVGATVKTGDGVGTIIETKPLAEEIRVKIGDGEKDTAKLYKIRDVKVLKMPAKRNDKGDDEDDEE
jgi:cell fate regulator YaaT (PSP1 superfamily)